MLRNGELVVRHLRIRMVPKSVDPPVAHPIAKLLLLPPENLVRQKRVIRSVKCFSEDVFFNPSLTDVDHLLLRINIHGHFEEVRVQEGHASLNTPSHRALIGPQAVVDVELGHFVDEFRVQFLFIGRLVEVEVARQDLIRSFATQDLRGYECVLTPSTRREAGVSLSDGVWAAPDAIEATLVSRDAAQDHLDAHGLDLARHEEHGRRRSYGGHVIGLQVMDHFCYSVETLL